MSFLQREYDRLMEFCQNTAEGPAYQAAYAAKQALAWALDPDTVASPSAQIGRHYELDMPEGTGISRGEALPPQPMN